VKHLTEQPKQRMAEVWSGAQQMKGGAQQSVAGSD